MLMRHETLQKERQRSVESECNFFKYMLGKQQIQQMSLLDEENGTAIFYKLKTLFFDENQDDEHIINVIRQEPIKVVGNMFYELTKSYNQKLNEIVEPLEEDKFHLLEKIRQIRQQLQHSMDDNQFFKATIDRLEEEKKQSQEKLNQSIDQFERSRDEIIYEIHEREKIRSEVMKIYVDAQEIYTQNSQLKHCIVEYEKKLTFLEEQNQKIRDYNNELIAINQDLTSKYNDAVKYRTIFREEIDDLQGKLHYKEQFIASFIDEYNKVHLFNQHQSSSRQYTATEKLEGEQNFNELQGFNFNNYDQHSIISEKSLSKDSSLRNLDSQMDEKFQCVNATAQKLKPKIPINYPCVTEEKANKKVQSKVNSKHKNINSKNRNASNKIEIVKMQSNKKVNKTLIKTVSSKNFQQKESMIVVTPSEGDQSKMMEEMLKKKLTQKNQKIIRLQSEVANLKDGFIEQRQKITIMEGQYELQIEQLKEHLAFTKKQLAKIFEKYAITSAQCQVYQEKIAQLQSEMTIIQQDHHIYCQELKIRCKAYVLKKIEQIENQYKSIKRSINDSAKSNKSQQNQDQGRLQYSLPSQQELPEEFHLQFKETSPQINQNYCQMDSLSEIQSYERIDNHFLNGFDLEFSAKLSNMDRNHEEIYIQQQFQIDSNLGMFTERLINDKVEFNRIRKGNFTDRHNNISISINYQENNSKKQSVLTINSKLYQQNIQLKKDRKLEFVKVFSEHSLIKKDKNLKLYKVVSIDHTPQLITKLNFDINVFQFTFQTRRSRNLKLIESKNVHKHAPSKAKRLNINETVQWTYQPAIAILRHYSSIINVNQFPINKNIFICSKLYDFSRSQKKYPQLNFYHIQDINFEMRKNRNFKIWDNEINIYQQIKKNPKKHNFHPFNFIHIQKGVKKLEITSRQCFFKVQILKECKQELVQTIETETCQSSTQIISELKQQNTQTFNDSTSSESQTFCYCAQAYSQTQFSTFLCQSQALYITSASQAQQTQTDYLPQSSQLGSKPQIKLFSSMLSQIQIESKTKSIKDTSKITIKSQILSYRFNPIISRLEDERNPYYISSPPRPQKNENFDYSRDITTQQREDLQLIMQPQINSHLQMRGSFNSSQLYLFNTIHIQKNTQNSKNNLKNKSLCLQINSQIDMEINIRQQNNSFLNNAILMSDSCLKDDGKTYNPQSKSYMAQHVNSSQISISPWFVDQFQEIQQKSSVSIIIPAEIVYHLSKQAEKNVLKYLQRHYLSLSFEQEINKINFKKPRVLKKKIHFAFVKNDKESEIFMITSNRIQNIRNNNYIKFEPSYRIDDGNFMFGQSEVGITGDRHLIINRSGKLNKLAGNLEDGDWLIQFYITCSCQRREPTTY